MPDTKTINHRISSFLLIVIEGCVLGAEDVYPKVQVSAGGRLVQVKIFVFVNIRNDDLLVWNCFWLLNFFS